MDGGGAEVYLGDRVKVRTMLGDRGNFIGQLPDGRAILFSRESPYLSMIGPNQEVDCHVVHVAHNYIIVEPIREPIPISEIVPHKLAPTPDAAPRETEPSEEVGGPQVDERPLSESAPSRQERPKVDKALIKDLKKIVERGGGGGVVARALLHIIRRLDRS